jgi:hypothetical protein
MVKREFFRRQDRSSNSRERPFCVSLLLAIVVLSTFGFIGLFVGVTLTIYVGEQAPTAKPGVDQSEPLVEIVTTSTGARNVSVHFSEIVPFKDSANLQATLHPASARSSGSREAVTWILRVGGAYVQTLRNKKRLPTKLIARKDRLTSRLQRWSRFTWMA